MISAVLIVTLLVAPPMAMQKREFVDGRVLNIASTKDVQSIPGSSGGSSRNIDGPGPYIPMNRVMFTYIVVANATRYQLQEETDKPRFKEGDTIKFAVDKKNWFYLDEKGKEKRGGEVKGTKKIDP